MEKGLFLTVANYSLPKDADKYLESLKNTPITPKHYYDYTRWLFPGFLFKLGRLKFPRGSAWKILYSKEDRFTEAELSGFEQRRKKLISLLDQISSGKPFSEIEGLHWVLVIANQLTREEKFKLGSEGIEKREAVFYPWARKGERSIIKPEESGRVELDYDALSPLLILACYDLSTFLEGDGAARIKKCPYCRKFFIAKDSKRKKCYELECRNEYHREDMKKRREEHPEKYC